MLIGIGIGIIIYYCFIYQPDKKDDDQKKTKIFIKGNGNKVKW